MRKLLFTAGIFPSLILNSQSINLEEFANRFTAPVEIAHANDSCLFVVQQNGIVKIL